MRHRYTGTFRDEHGDYIASGSVAVYLGGTGTAASIYTAVDSATAVNSVTTDANGRYTFYVSRFDYNDSQTFKFVCSKSGYTSVTVDDITIEDAVLTTYSITADTTVTTDIYAPVGCIYTVATGKVLTFSGKFDGSLSQHFTGAGTVAFGVGATKEVYSEWWGAYSDGTNQAATKDAIQSALNSLPGIDEPTNLITCTTGGVVRLLAGTYAIDEEIVITKSNTKLIGAGSHNTIIKCESTGLLTDMVRFKDTNYSEISYMKLDGNCSASTVGAKACLGIDQAAFLVSYDLYIANSTLYGIRAAHCWESMFYNTQIRNTGFYSEVGTVGAAIMFTDTDQESTTFTGYESNNTVFVKPTLVPYGGLVYVKADGVNLMFIHPITDTTAYSSDQPFLHENQWYFGARSAGCQIIGGYHRGALIPVQSTGALFKFDASNYGNVVSGYYVHTPEAPDGTYIYTTFNEAINADCYFPLTIDNVTIFDPNKKIPVISVKGATYESKIIGNGVSVLTTTDRTIDDMFNDDNDSRNAWLAGFTKQAAGVTTEPVINTPLVTNGGFDSATTGWTATDATLASIAGGWSGNCLRVTNSGAAAGNASQVVTVTPEEKYCLTFYFKKGTAVGGYLNVDGTVTSVRYIDKTYTDADWANYTYYFEAKPTDTSVTIYLSVNSTTISETALFDSVLISKVIQ